MSDPPRAGWEFTATRGHTGEEYASDRGPLNHAGLVELNGTAADIREALRDSLEDWPDLQIVWHHINKMFYAGLQIPPLQTH